MRLRPLPIEIPADDPFKNDVLDRLPCADFLSVLLETANDPIVISIDASWGRGKTTFLQMWKGYLQNKGYPVIYYNAWENDYLDNAILSIIGEISAALPTFSLEGGHRNSAEKQIETIKKSGIQIAKRVVPVALRVATHGLIDSKDVADGLSGLFERVASETIERYEKGKQEIASLKHALDAFARELSEQTAPAGQRQLVVMVDELDRCRPDFAVDVLEAIKHLFSVSNVAFVLAMNCDQLGRAVKKLYGPETEADGYLSRFFDFRFTLPDPTPEAFCKVQFARFGLEQFFVDRSRLLPRDKIGVEENFARLFSVFECSFRDQERCFSQLVLAARTTPTDFYLFPPLLTFLIVLKEKHVGVYRKLARGEMMPWDVMDFVARLPGGREFVDSRVGLGIEAYLVRRYGEFDDTLAEQYRERKNGAEAMSAARSHQVLGIVEEIRDAPPLDYLIDKIDMISRVKDRRRGS